MATAVNTSRSARAPLFTSIICRLRRSAPYPRSVHDTRYVYPSSKVLLQDSYRNSALLRAPLYGRCSEGLLQNGQQARPERVSAVGQLPRLLGSSKGTLLPRNSNCIGVRADTSLA